MIVEGNNYKWLSNAPYKNCGQMVKISGSREHEGPKSPPELFVKLFDCALRRDESKGSPDLRRIYSLRRVDPSQRLKIPSVVEDKPRCVSTFQTFFCYHSSLAFANF
jgi:hypothetical protein